MKSCHTRLNAAHWCVFIWPCFSSRRLYILPPQCKLKHRPEINTNFPRMTSYCLRDMRTRTCHHIRHIQYTRLKHLEYVGQFEETHYAANHQNQSNTSSDGVKVGLHCCTQSFYTVLRLTVQHAEESPWVMQSNKQEEKNDWASRAVQITQFIAPH